jgi:hypothetical protein
MPNKTVLALFTLFTGLIASSPAYAYLDPGSGSVLLQGLLAGTAGLIAILKIYWQRFKVGFLQLKNKLCPQKTASAPSTPPPIEKNNDPTSDSSD